MGAVAMLLSGRDARDLIERRVDWSTLSFFLMLFAAVGATREVGVTRTVAAWLIDRTGGSPAALVLAIGWGTGWLSALLDNMMAVATFLPVVAEVKSHGQPCPQAVYWLMLFGGTLMGNMTPIGSTCNIIAGGLLEKRGHAPVRFVDWLKIGAIVSLASMALATFLLAARTHWLTE